MIEPRRSALLLSVSGGASPALASSAAIAESLSSFDDIRTGLPELARLLSKAPKTLLFVGGDSAIAASSPSAPALESRVRSANSGPSGASSGFELRSVPRVRPMPALEEDMRRKSIGFASGGTWLRLVGCELFDGNRVECTEGAGALL